MNEGRNMVLQNKILSGRVIYLENENARLKDSLSRYEEKDAEKDALAENHAAVLKENAELREELKQAREEIDRLKAVHEIDEKEKESLKVELATANISVMEAGESIKNMHEQLERTRLTVRSRKSRDEKFKYRTEMIQAVLAPAEKTSLCFMKRAADPTMSRKI